MSASPPRPTPAALFLAFSQMGLLGFGGVLPWARRVLVDRRRWLDDRGFAELLSLGQILPGPNICNLSVMYGYRVAGLAGSLAALGGLVSAPFVLVVTLALAYRHCAEVPAVADALRGMTAVAAGLVIASALRLAASQPRSLRAVLSALLAFVALGLLHWPLLPVMAALAPLALWFTARELP